MAISITLISGLMEMHLMWNPDDPDGINNRPGLFFAISHDKTHSAATQDPKTAASACCQSSVNAASSH